MAKGDKEISAQDLQGNKVQETERSKIKRSDYEVERKIFSPHLITILSKISCPQV